MARELDEAQEWRIVDDILHLRERGTANTHPLPPRHGDGVIGNARDSWIRTSEPSGKSVQHARIARIDQQWLLREIHSPEGIRLDGLRHSAAFLVPGMEIEIGDLTLVAESARLVALREGLMRLLGWADERRVQVELALRAVRMAALHREVLLLCGAGPDVESAARVLHQRTLGNEYPFIVCERADNVVKAVKAAAGGTLCVWPGPQVAKVVSAIQRPTPRAQRVQVMVLGDTSAARRWEVLIKSPIVIPPLRKRTAELDRIIDEYLLDATTARGGSFLPEDRKWIRRYDAKSLSRIETATQRLVVLRSTGVTRAASILGVAHASLSEWVARRKIPMISTTD